MCVVLRSVTAGLGPFPPEVVAVLVGQPVPPVTRLRGLVVAVSQAPHGEDQGASALPDDAASCRIPDEQLSDSHGEVGDCLDVAGLTDDPAPDPAPPGPDPPSCLDCPPSHAVHCSLAHGLHTAPSP